MLNKLEDSIKADVERVEKTQDLYQLHRENIAVIANGLKKLESRILSVSIDSISLDISIAGDRHDLNAAFSALRKIGYKPDSRPESGKSSYTAWFRKEGWITVYLIFSSTQCRRIKIGTETKTIDVYETVCD